MYSNKFERFHLKKIYFYNLIIVKYKGFLINLHFIEFLKNQRKFAEIL